MLTVGDGESASIAGSVRCMDKYNMPYKLIKQEEHKVAFPMLNFPDNFTYMVDISAGILQADKALLVFQVCC